MKIAILSAGYPSELSGEFLFVHLRAQHYIQLGHVVKAFVIQNKTSKYKWEDISVYKGRKHKIEEAIRQFHPDILAIHYPTYWMESTIRKMDCPKVVWILGHEMLWSFRLMSAENPMDWVKKRMVLLPRLAYQIYSISNLIKDVNYTIFVSKWLLEATQRHTLTHFDNAVIIPNPVDTEQFTYETPRNISRGISVRSLERSVYGIDVAIKAFSNFKSADLSVFGRGSFYQKYLRMIEKQKSNCQIHYGHILHKQLPNIYHQYGFFVAPSREETQGLAMCEAMACGLPVVASNVGGIPEFVRDGVDGYLTSPNDPSALRRAVQQLLSDKERYLRMSTNAREHIVDVCAAKMIIRRELEVMTKAISAQTGVSV